MIKRNQCFLFFFGLLSLLSCQQIEPKKAPPNILFIMTDDHANDAISAYGSEILQTPNIDRIAKEGILFENSFVTNSICAPSRAVLLTGKYSHLNSLRDNRDQFDGSQMTFPKLLQSAGYHTAMIGKWHLKTAPTGFDYWNILIGQGPYYNPSMVENGDTSKLMGYTTDVITDLTLQALEKRDTTKPFCMLYHHKAPHRNWMPHPKYFDLFKNEELPLPENFYDDYQTRSAAAAEQDMRIDDMYLSLDMKLHPEDYGGKDTGTGGSAGYDPGKSWLNSLNNLTLEQRSAWDAHYDEVRRDYRETPRSEKELLEWKYQRYIKDYLRCVASVDDNIGRVLKYLDENGLAENTLVVYTSDQGFYLGEHGWYDKRFMYEESLRMPLVMRLPGVIQPGSTAKEMALNLDFAPTFLDFAKVAIPSEMQGHSLRPILEGQSPKGWRTAMYYHYYEYPHGWHDVKQHYGIRNEQHKLIHFYNDIDAWELYDLESDPGEMKNVYNDPKNANLVAKLKEDLQVLRAEFQVPGS